MKKFFTPNSKAEVAQPAIVPYTPEFLRERMQVVMESFVKEMRLIATQANNAGHFHTAEFGLGWANTIEAQVKHDFYAYKDNRALNNSVQENA